MSAAAGNESLAEGVQTVGAGQTRGLAEQMAWTVIAGRKGVLGSVMAGEAAEVREATTGRVVTTLPKVWAVAAPVRVKSRQEVEAAEEDESGFPVVEVGFYRKYTEGLLRRYVQMSMESGRVPSMMGRSVLGGKASSYRIHGFDDAVIFRLDVEKCLKRLEKDELEVIRRVAMQEYTQAEAAPLLGICLRTCVQRYGRAIDQLTRILLEVKLLEPFKALSSGGR